MTGYPLSALLISSLFDVKPDTKIAESHHLSRMNAMFSLLAANWHLMTQ